MVEQKTEMVSLVCIKEGSRLRVRITTNGYLKDANCQFPRKMRAVGLHYLVSPANIKLIQTRGKYFYSVSGNIEVVKQEMKIYEDDGESECVICYDDDKEIVFEPCGHLYTCAKCANKILKCPCCRVPITGKIARAMFL